MKTLILLALFLASFVQANEISLDEQIANMKTAPQEQRYELMNSIKQRIASMNGAKRAEVIAKFGHGKKGIPHEKNSIHNMPNTQEQYNKQTGLGIPQAGLQSHNKN